MINLYVILIHIAGVLFLNSLFNENVSTKISIPGQVEAGKEFTVQITVTKGAIEGFSRFQQQLPAGLTAKPIENANGEFRFSDKKLRLMWLALPAQETVSFSYKVIVDQRLKGNFNLQGDFSYIENNERKTIPVVSNPITIKPSTTIDPSLIVDINDFEKFIVPDLSNRMAGVTAIRQNPINTNNGTIVNILVHKNGRDKFAKIEENIPAGYTVENIDNKGGIFTFKNNTLKYLWMTVPAGNFFVVSYKLVPLPDKKQGNMLLNGYFSYIDGSETKTTNIVQSDADLTKITDENINDLLASVTNKKIEQPISQNEIAEVIKEKTSEEIIKEEIKTIEEATTKENENLTASIEKEAVKEVITQPIEEKTEKKPIVKEPKKPIIKIPSFKKDNIIDLEAENGIYYRVQLAAGHRPVNIARYFKKFNLDKTVKREQHEGWLKYSVGSFPIYKDARDYRNNLWENKKPIDDAFVAAYNNGTRITVQEALMISNQLWYK